MTFEKAIHEHDNIIAPDIYFHIPDFLNSIKLIQYFVNAKKETPYIFRPGVNIGAVYGIFPGCIWNGGTLIVGNSFSKEEMRDVIGYYNYELNLPITFTFTNPIINTNQCYDTYCNVMAELGHNGINNINVASSVLAEYLKKNYPNYHYCRSIIASKDIPYDLNGWSLSVLQRAKNNDWDYLNSIPVEDRERIEILLNDPCDDNCPSIYEHYRILGYSQASYSCDQAKNPQLLCPYPSDMTRARMMCNNHTYISEQQLYDEYVPAGFRNFKFSGRASLIRTTLGALRYMVWPLYHEDILFDIFNDYMPSVFNFI